MNHTKEEILQAALRLFALDGYEAVSVSRIAAELGITKGALYRHYQNKRDIFDQILERMQTLDYERALAYEMPAQAADENEKAYQNLPIAPLIAYCKAEFDYWTKEEFPRRFRQTLTIEQHRNPQMQTLFQQYLAAGPLGYLEDIFRGLDGNAENAKHLALVCYAPMFLLYSVYDASEDKSAVTALLASHLDQFANRLQTACSDNNPSQITGGNRI